MRLADIPFVRVDSAGRVYTRPPGMKPKSISQRFWPKVDRSAGLDACWPWSAAKSPAGYGKMTTGGRKGQIIGAHRISYELNVAPIPDGLWVLHRCDNPPCVNPAHLFLGDCEANVHDMWSKGRASPPPPPTTETAAGERNPMAKLTRAKVANMRAEYASGVRQCDLATQYGVSRSIVCNIIAGTRWA